MTYKAIDNTTLRAAAASDSESSEAEDQDEASAVARDLTQQPDQASSSAPQPLPDQAAPHQVPTAQRTLNQATAQSTMVPNQVRPKLPAEREAGPEDPHEVQEARNWVIQSLSLRRCSFLEFKV